MTGDDDRAAWRWDIDELPDDLPRFSAWVEVLSGPAIDERGRIRVLTTAEWLGRREIQDRLGGPPGAETCGWREPVLLDDSAHSDGPLDP